MIRPIRSLAVLAGVFCSLTLLSPLYSLGASAQDASSSTSSSIADIVKHDITITGGVLRPYMRPQNSAAGYFTIRNNSATDVLLQGVTSPVCQAVSSNHNGQDLVQISGAGNDIFQHFAIPHQSTLVFPEDGYHLLCRGITKMPAPGDNVPFIFHFMDGGTVTATFKAQDITAHNSSLQ